MKTHQTKFEDVLTLRLLRFTAFILLLLAFYSCSESKKMQKAVNRVLADREAMNKVGEKWRDLNPCANTYTPGQWFQLTDSANVTLPRGSAFFGPGSTTADLKFVNPYPEAQVPKLIPPATDEPNNPEPIPFIVGELPQEVLKISADRKTVFYDGKTYKLSPERWLRVDTVRDRNLEDSLRAYAHRLNNTIANLQGQIQEKDKQLKEAKSRGDSWFTWFIVAVVVGIVLLIGSHLIRSQFKLPKIPV